MIGATYPEIPTGVADVGRWADETFARCLEDAYPCRFGVESARVALSETLTELAQARERLRRVVLTAPRARVLWYVVLCDDAGADTPREWNSREREHMRELVRAGYVERVGRTVRATTLGRSDLSTLIASRGGSLGGVPCSVSDSTGGNVEPGAL